MRNRHLLPVLAVASALALGVAACSGSSVSMTGPSGSSGSPTVGSGLGQLNVSMTDSPFGDALAVFVIISDISVHGTEGVGWQPVDLGGEIACDLKKLENGLSDLLGAAVLEAVMYTQIRVSVSGGSIIFDENGDGGDGMDGDGGGEVDGDACVPADELVEPVGMRAELFVPSGVLHLNRPFRVPDGGMVNLVLDFHGHDSIREWNGGGNGACKGNNPNCVDGDGDGDADTYRLDPVISVYSLEEIPAHEHEGEEGGGEEGGGEPA